MPLRVTIELIPHGDESKASVIGKIDIENTGKGTDALGIYRYSLVYGDVNSSRYGDCVRADGILDAFPRRLGRLALVQAVMYRIETGSPFMWYEAAPEQSGE